MSTDLATTSSNGLATGGIPQEQVDLIKRTLAKEATNDELALFIAQCNRTGLDPFNRQIWFTKRQGKVNILTGIDGYRLIGERTGRRAGSDTWWCGDDGQWREVWLASGRPAAAKTVVRKMMDNGTIVEYTGIALWSEYGEKADGFMWPKMPAAQLGKCSEALAYRKAFPAETSGLYVQEEMDQVQEEMDQAAMPERVAAVPPRPQADPSTGEVKVSRPKRQPPVTTTSRAAEPKPGNGNGGSVPNWARNVHEAITNTGGKVTETDLDFLIMRVTGLRTGSAAELDGSEANRVIALIAAVVRGELAMGEVRSAITAAQAQKDSNEEPF